MSVFNQDQENDIIQMYKNKEPIDDIIKKYNTEEHFIREVLKDNSIDRKRTSFSDELHDRIVYLYQVERCVYNYIEYQLLVSENGIKGTLKRRIHSPMLQ